MDNEKDIRDELNELAPGFPEKKSMAPPPGYFDIFPEEILNRWRKEQSQSLPKTIIWKRIAGIAAVIAGLCMAGWLFLAIPSPGPDAISAVEAYQYIHENIEDFESLMDIENDGMIEDHGISKEEIEEYLFEETDGSDPEDLF